jgi:hypothetical protein
MYDSSRFTLQTSIYDETYSRFCTFGASTMNEIITAAEEPLAPDPHASPTEEILDVCQHTQPEKIWDALDAKGIETTPGVIHQAINHPVSTESTVELGAEDLTILGALATKAGGIAQLIRILTALQEKSA